MYSLLTHDRICQHCGKEFVSQKRSTKYCSHRCANLADKARKKAQKQLLKQENAKEERRQVSYQQHTAELAERDASLITREEVTKTYSISTAWFFSQLKKHGIKAQRIAGGCFYNKEDMERIFSYKEFLHITEWYTFQQLKDMTGFRTESICEIIRTNKIPKKKINNCVYVSKKH